MHSFQSHKTGVTKTILGTIGSGRYGDIDRFPELIESIGMDKEGIRKFILENSFISQAAKYGDSCSVRVLTSQLSSCKSDKEESPFNPDGYSPLLGAMRCYVSPMRLPGSTKSDLRQLKYQSKYPLSRRDESYWKVFFELIFSCDYEASGLSQLATKEGCSAAWFIVHVLKGHFAANGSDTYQDACQHKRGKQREFVKIFPETQDTTQCAMYTLAICFLLDPDIMSLKVKCTNKYDAPSGTSADAVLKASIYHREIEVIINSAKRLAMELDLIIKGKKSTSTDQLVSAFDDFIKDKNRDKEQMLHIGWSTLARKEKRIQTDGKQIANRYTDLEAKELDNASDGDDSPLVTIQYKKISKEQLKSGSKSITASQLRSVVLELIIEKKSSMTLSKSQFVHEEEQEVTELLVEILLEYKNKLFTDGLSPKKLKGIISPLVNNYLSHEEEIGLLATYLPAILTGYDMYKSKHHLKIDVAGLRNYLDLIETKKTSHKKII